MQGTLLISAIASAFLLGTSCRSSDADCDITHALARGTERAETELNVILLSYTNGVWLPSGSLKTRALKDPARHLPAAGTLSFHASPDGKPLAEIPADGPMLLEDLAFSAVSSFDPATLAAKRKVLEGATFALSVPREYPAGTRFLRWRPPGEPEGLRSVDSLFIDLEKLGPATRIEASSRHSTPEGIESDLPVETVHFSGDPRRRLNLLVLADGYLDSQLDDFRADSEAMVADLFTHSPYKEYKNLINVIRVPVASRRQGADCDDGKFSLRGTRYNSTFPVACINALLHTHLNDRFIHQLNFAAVTHDKLSIFYKGVSIVDEVYILVHSPKWGGATISWATQTDRTPWDTASHEMGHSWGRLGDEYLVPGDMCHIYMAAAANMSFKHSSRDKVKWKQWILPETPIPTPDTVANLKAVGLFQGAAGNCKKVLYRPTTDCKMETSRRAFCPVCMEQMILRIYERANPIEGALTLESGQIQAKLTNGERLRTRWYVDGKLAQETSAYAPLPYPTEAGVKHQVRLVTFDESAPVRRDRCDLVFAVEQPI